MAEARCRLSRGRQPRSRAHATGRCLVSPTPVPSRALSACCSRSPRAARRGHQGRAILNKPGLKPPKQGSELGSRGHAEERVLRVRVRDGVEVLSAHGKVSACSGFRSEPRACCQSLNPLLRNRSVECGGGRCGGSPLCSAHPGTQSHLVGAGDAGARMPTRANLCAHHPTHERLYLLSGSS